MTRRMRGRAGTAATLAVLACTADAVPRATVIDMDRPEITLTDTEGRSFPFAQATAGHATLLFFGYTSCPDVCPIHMAALGRAVEGLPQDVRPEMRVVFVTVDPDRDTPAILREWLDHFGRDFTGLRGTVSEVDAFLAALLLPPVVRDGDVPGHSMRVFAFPAAGGGTFLYDPDTLLDDLTHDLPILLGR